MKLLETDAVGSIFLSKCSQIRDITIRADQRALVRKFRSFRFIWLGLNG